jgi:hypothetical protein
MQQIAAGYSADGMFPALVSNEANKTLINVIVASVLHQSAVDNVKNAGSQEGEGSAVWIEVAGRGCDCAFSGGVRRVWQYVNRHRFQHDCAADGGVGGTL